MAAKDVFGNRATTTVASGGTTAPASGTVETWTVASTAGFPAAATGVTQFRLQEDDVSRQSEIMLATNTSGVTWTVTRGAEGTTPVAHPGGFTIVQTLTAASLAAFVAASGATTIDGVLTFTTNPVTASGIVLLVPVIADFTSAGHSHGNTAGGGAIPESSVTSLVADLAAKYSGGNPPPYPVSSVAGKRGAVSLVEGDIANLTSDLSNLAHLTGAETLDSKTMTNATLNTPSISDFSGALHDHSGTSASGGLAVGPRGYVAGATGGGTVTFSASLNVETTILTASSFTYVFGRRYRFTAFGRYNPGTAGCALIGRIKDGGTTLATCEKFFASAAAGNAATGICVGESNTLSGSKSLTFTGTAGIGPNPASSFSQGNAPGFFLTIEDIGT